MSFIKPITIYEAGESKVYINQCHAKKRKTNIYTIRRDDDKGFGHYLGLIYFNPRWRQYVFESSDDVIWNSMCLIGINTFLVKINNQWRWKHAIHKK